MKGLAKEAFAAAMGGPAGDKAEVSLEDAGQAAMGKRIRMALESKDDAALCRAVKEAVASDAAYGDDDEEMDA